MNLIADILLAAGAIGAGLYCFVLGQRLKKFNSLENGVGGAVAVLSSQVEDLKQTMEKAQLAAQESVNSLEELNNRGEDISKRLEIQMAALHDLPGAQFDEQSSSELTPQGQTATNNEPMFVRHASGGN